MPKGPIIHDARIMLKMPRDLLAWVQKEIGRGKVSAFFRNSAIKERKRIERQREREREG